jgi:hypothetical protein
MFPGDPVRGALLGAGIGFTIGFGALGGFSFLGMLPVRAQLALGLSLLGVLAYTGSTALDFLNPSDPAPPNLQPEWTADSLQSHIDALPNSQNEKNAAHQSMAALLQAVQRVPHNAAPGEACHVYVETVRRPAYGKLPSNAGLGFPVLPNDARL